MREVAINAELIEEERRQRERAANLPASVFEAVKYALGQRSQSSHRHYLLDAPRSLPSSASLGVIDASKEPTSPNAKTARQQGPGTGVRQVGSAAAPPQYYSNLPTSPSRAHGQHSHSLPPQSPGAQMSWHEEGLYYWVFLPLNLPKAALRLANEKVRGAVTDAGYDNGYQAAIRQAHETQQQRTQQRLPMMTSPTSPASSKPSLRTPSSRPFGNLPQARSPIQ